MGLSSVANGSSFIGTDTCARLDLLGFELCSPEVLLDLQDLDHELPPTTRELVQALGITV